MEPENATLRVLEKIQETLVRMDGRLAEHGERQSALEHATAAGFAKLHDGVAITNETLGVIRERLVFAEAASGAATTARARLDDRMDRLEARVNELEARVDTKGG